VDSRPNCWLTPIVIGIVVTVLLLLIGIIDGVIIGYYWWRCYWQLVIGQLLLWLVDIVIVNCDPDDPLVIIDPDVGIGIDYWRTMTNPVDWASPAQAVVIDPMTDGQTDPVDDPDPVGRYYWPQTDSYWLTLTPVLDPVDPDIGQPRTQLTQWQYCWPYVLLLLLVGQLLDSWLTSDGPGPSWRPSDWPLLAQTDPVSGGPVGRTTQPRQPRLSPTQLLLVIIVDSLTVMTLLLLLIGIIIVNCWTDPGQLTQLLWLLCDIIVIGNCYYYYYYYCYWYCYWYWRTTRTIVANPLDSYWSWWMTQLKWLTQPISDWTQWPSVLLLLDNDPVIDNC